MIASRLSKVLACLGIVMLPLTTLTSSTAQAATDQEAGKVLKVCAVPQLYNALTRLQLSSPIKFESNVATSSDLYADLVNSNEHKCDVLLSSDERLPLQLASTGKTDAGYMQPFAKVKLLLWSPNPRLINSTEGQKLFTEQKLKSIAVAKGELTPVGYASEQVLKQPELKASFLKDHTYRTDNEYQVYSMVQEGNVEAGFVTTPLVLTLTRQMNGSYWEVPEDFYPTIQYYATIMKGDAVPTADAQKFIEFLKTDEKAASLLEALGFYPLNPDSK